MAIVIGAGICGLAAAYELAKRGEEVLVLERGEGGGEQSAGLGRIFRIAHGQARLCALALRARGGGRRREGGRGGARSPWRCLTGGGAGRTSWACGCSGTSGWSSPRRRRRSRRRYRSR